MPPRLTTELPSDMPAAIRQAKAQLREQIGDVAGAFAEVDEAMRREVAAVVAEREAGRELFPIVRFTDIAAGTVPEDTVASIRRRGCAVVRGNFPRGRAEQWDARLAAYLEENRFAQSYRGYADDVFDGLASSKPQIYGVYVLLRALQEDVADDDLCGAANGQALPIGAKWHPVLLPALSPIPAVEPGDTVWWHCDVIHAVADLSAHERWGNVMYIPSSPYCEKNARYAVACGQAFLTGASPSDFAPEDYEVNWIGRGTLEDLNPVGRRQLGLEAW